MDALVLGGGRMGLAIAYDMAKSGADVQLGDVNERCMEKLPVISDMVEFLRIDASDVGQAGEAMRGKDVVISALPYDFNYGMAKMAIGHGANFCDLGGNIDIVERELSLDGKAREAGVAVIPDCGLAPGTTNVIASHLIEKTDASEMHIRVGGLPQKPKPPLGYALVFSVHGLINEYIEKARIIRGGEVAEVESLTGIESISFDRYGFGELEAFYTSGGTSTLPETFRGRIDELDYKTIRYRGHCDKIRFLKDMGFFEGDNRRFTERIMEKALGGAAGGGGEGGGGGASGGNGMAGDVRDVVLARWTAAGGGSGSDTVSMDMVDYYDEKEHISSMMRTTGFPTSIIARMIVNGDIEEKGVMPPERCVPPGKFISELGKRNINIRETESR